ncbi:ABC transporter ATP-binding protein [Taklimakanibacter deserti]|uniref:ABC transporter ATP-binding protein n=1 Tax=Taklimakanibacter deserti TaxID=2267839 RepID=UPI000E64E46A
MAETLLEVAHLIKTYPARGKGQKVQAVADASLALARGETLGLVGESGCGKSTLSRLILSLVAADQGAVRIAGADFLGAPREEQRLMRRRIQIVFQDALSSLNPRMTVGVNIAEPMRLQGLGTQASRREEARQLLELVGLRAEDEDRYPHEFSGGQCQRIAIARALVLKPDIVIFDEAVSALDVSIRAQILRLILDLQQKFGLSYIFISHDLSVVKRICDRIAVMYLGRIVEIGSSDAVCGSPRHPYTEALLRAIPIADPRRMRVENLGLIEGDTVAAAGPSGGCAFEPRCPHRFARCGLSVPPLFDIAAGHRAACFLNETDRQQGDP